MSERTTGIFRDTGSRRLADHGNDADAMDRHGGHIGALSVSDTRHVDCSEGQAGACGEGGHHV